MRDDPFTLYGLAADGFGALVARVRAADWTAPTPCAGWNVRDLVRHVVEENLWAARLFAGLTLDEAAAQLPADPLAPDPRSAWTESVDAALTVASDERTPHRTVHLSFGETPAIEYAMQLTADHVVHAWDLAVALSLPGAPPTQLVTAVLDWFGPHESAYRAAGAVGPRPDVPTDADDLTRLLAAFGRTR